MLDQTLPVAEEAVGSFLETILGEKIPLEVDEPETVGHDELEERFEGRFALLGRSGASEPFVGLLDVEWLPVLSEAMLGEEMNDWNDDADDLVNEVANQAYASIRNRLSGEGIDLEEADFTVLSDAAGLPSDLLGNEFEAIELSAEHEETALTGTVMVPAGALEESPRDVEEEAQTEDPEFGAADPTSGSGPTTAGPASEAGEPAPSPGPTPADEIDRSGTAEDEKVSVSSPSFPAFDEGPAAGDGTSQGDLSSMDLLGDVEIELSVELGRRNMPLQDILRLTNGSIVELDKLAGEPLQIYANNRLVAEGEAVVIDDQFGVRITRLASTEKRARALM